MQFIFYFLCFLLVLCTVVLWQLQLLIKFFRKQLLFSMELKIVKENTESKRLFKRIQIFNMEFSNLVNYSTNMCWNCPCIMESMLFSGAIFCTWVTKTKKPQWELYKGLFLFFKATKMQKSPDWGKIKSHMLSYLN